MSYAIKNHYGEFYSILGIWTTIPKKAFILKSVEEIERFKEENEIQGRVTKTVYLNRPWIEILRIKRTVESYLCVEDMNIKSQKRQVVLARQITMWFSKKNTCQSLADIGNEIGGKDHATVLHAVKTINNLIETNQSIRNQVRDIEKILAYGG